jgi:hypothetical protein
MPKGWWHLATNIEDPSDTTLNHIADLILQGFTSGPIDEEEEPTE